MMTSPTDVQTSPSAPSDDERAASPEPAANPPQGAKQKTYNIHRKRIPEHLYDDIRKTANRQRRVRTRQNKRARMEQQRQEEEAKLTGLTEEERVRLTEERAAKEQAESAARIKAHLEQMARVQAALESGLRVVVDCSFTELCSTKEMRSLAKQLEMSAGLNKKAAAPVALAFTSFAGTLADYARGMGSEGWKARLVPESLMEAFPAAEVVVLSPDAEEPLLEVRQEQVYCIGGIVDRSVKKHVTLKYAEERQMVARRLPVPEFAEQLGLGPGTCRKPVLNVNDVVLALMEFHASGDWVKALDAAIPGRKRKQHTLPAAASTIPSTQPAAPDAVPATTGDAQEGAGGLHPAAPTLVTEDGCHPSTTGAEKADEQNAGPRGQPLQAASHDGGEAGRSEVQAPTMQVPDAAMSSSSSV